jgi:hypothetical protein
MNPKYRAPIKYLGGSALIALVIAFIFPTISAAVFSEETRNAILIMAIPFVAAFIAVLLTFILLIFIVALRFNRKIPARTYQPVERVIIVGIIAGVVLLFQPFHFVGYKYGFPLLLVSLLAFIMFSHVLPKSSKEEATSFKPIQHIAGIVVAFLVWAVLTYSAVSVNSPREPYGLRQRIFDSYDEERQAQVAAEATSTFYSVELPFLLLMNLIPAAAAYFLVREATGALLNGGQQHQEVAATAAGQT